MTILYDCDPLFPQILVRKAEEDLLDDDQVRVLRKVLVHSVVHNRVAEHEVDRAVGRAEVHEADHAADREAVHEVDRVVDQAGQADVVLDADGAVLAERMQD